MRKRLSRIGTSVFYWTTVSLMRGLLSLLARWKATGRERVPKEGGLLVVSNHLHNADPPVLAAGMIGRRVVFMAKSELFKLPFGLLPRLWGAFPVRRLEADMAAMLNAERVIRRGEVLGMFPEGTRSKSGTLGKPHPGTAVIALRTGATVLPCAITGSEAISSPMLIVRRPKVSVTVGEPFQVERVKRPSEDQIQELSARIMDEIGAMLPERYGGSYTRSEGVTVIDG